MRLGQLTGLEKEKLQAEFDELEKFIARCEQILASTEEQLAIVKTSAASSRQGTGTPAAPRSPSPTTSSIPRTSMPTKTWS